MPATVVIYEKNGAGGTTTDKTSGTIRFKNADNSTVDLNNPMVKPPSGSDWSFEKWIRAAITGGTFSQITNLVCYTDGSSGLGTGINIGGRAVTAYAPPAEGTSSTGYANMFTYTSASPLTLGAGPFSSVAQIGDHLVMLAEVQSTATGGLTSSETLTFAWDEI